MRVPSVTIRSMVEELMLWNCRSKEVCLWFSGNHGRKRRRRQGMLYMDMTVGGVDLDVGY